MRASAALAFLVLLVSAHGFAQATGGTGGTAAPAAAAAGTTTPAAGSQAAAGGSAAAAAAPAVLKPDDLPRDASTSWKVGICVLSSSGLSPDNDYLAYSLPLLLKNELSGLTRHQYGDDEKGLERRFIISTEVAAAEKTLTSARKDRDALLFNEVAAGNAAWAAADRRISDAIIRLAFLRALQPFMVDVKDSKPVTIVEGTGAGKLLPVPDVPPAVACAQQGLDLLVGGSVDEVQGYLLLDIWAFDPLSGKDVFRARNAAARDELYASIPVFGREIARTILGRPWALVAFAPDPPQASLYVDGTLAASGATPVLYLEPGPHEVRMSAPGYAEVTKSVDFAEGQETRIAETLTKEVGGRIEVSSDPPGADLYLDSFWLGKTPLSVDRPPVRSRATLTLKGFYDAPFSLEPSSADAVSLELQKDVGARDVARTKARDEFYTSLGIFAFSLPVPAFAYGFAIDFALKANDLGFGPAADQARSTAGVLLDVYYGGIAVSAALFTWMVARVVRYVKTANEIAN